MHSKSRVIRLDEIDGLSGLTNYFTVFVWNFAWKCKGFSLHCTYTFVGTLAYSLCYCVDVELLPRIIIVFMNRFSCLFVVVYILI